MQYTDINQKQVIPELLDSENVTELIYNISLRNRDIKDNGHFCSLTLSKKEWNKKPVHC